MFGAGLRTPPFGRPKVSRAGRETFGRALWLGPPLIAAVPETGYNRVFQLFHRFRSLFVLDAQ
jgi:hypothetical protein